MKTVIGTVALSRLREHFEAKLQATKQLADVVDAVKHHGSNLVLLDLRDRDDYHSGHIEGAVSMPLDEIDKRYGELPGDKEIVTYCYNLDCHISTRGALKLVEHGIPAKEMNAGWSEWVKASYPTHGEADGSKECGDHCVSRPKKIVV
jgi:rhodanese-related sulfurtransferase